jgi:hypothetical protein
MSSGCRRRLHKQKRVLYRQAACQAYCAMHDAQFNLQCLLTPLTEPDAARRAEQASPRQKACESPTKSDCSSKVPPD